MPDYEATPAAQVVDIPFRDLYTNCGVLNVLHLWVREVPSVRAAGRN
jgi:hypothetical protein